MMGRDARRQTVMPGRGLAALFASVAAVMAFAPPARANFGIVPGSFDFSVTNQDGSPDTQAGSHPYEVTSGFRLNTMTDAEGNMVPDGNVKDVVDELPPGLIGDPEALPRCTLGELDSETGCPNDAQVGVLTVLIAGTGTGTITHTDPIYNLVPRPGVPAEFGFLDQVVVAHLDASLRTGSDYGVTITSPNITEFEPVVSASATFWGVPAVGEHDRQRCRKIDIETALCDGSTASTEPHEAGVAPKPLLTLPGSCSEPPAATLRVDSWEKPGEFLPAFATLPALTGCYKLDFSPTIAVKPDTMAADSASGLHVNLSMPQNENPAALGEADLRTAVVRLPAGLSVNPAAADGLVGCSEEQIGLHNALAPTCPGASKIGTVSVETPLLPPHAVNGSVYLAQQGNLPGNGSNPFASLLAIYVTAEDPTAGVIVKLAGKVEVDPVTGQLTTTFDNNPPLPFSEFKLDLFGGPRGELITPQTCGTYTTTSSMMPWSAPDSGPSATPTDPQFVIGSRCNPAGFAPSFTAGSTNNQAGAFSPLTVTLSRGDGEQRLSGVTVKTPVGLLGMLSKVTLCGEPQASTGTCPAASRIGHTTVGAGAGSDPVFIPQAGKPQDPVYLTGPYKGAPFGLSVVVPPEAGPFNLGDNGRPVVVRASVSVDPKTAQITVTSDPMPTILQGIPLDVRTINVTIDRQEFIFNPTNCERLSMVGTLASTQGASAAVSSPFQVANCATLPFKPSFTVSTQARTGKAGGASLHVRVTSGRGQANIGRVKVDLPKQLPSRLTTLQKACTAAVFEGNPAACPAGSVVGTATAVTPVLRNALTGPAYLVSHGGAAFPDLEIVLQAEGITLVLDGRTDIKKGITSSSFQSVPDAPVSTFDLVLPQGPHSALAAYGSLCRTRLTMPTTLTGQNGAVVRQSTRITVTGCPKSKSKSRPRKSKSRGAHRPRKP
jgi:hypothetical protein